MVCRVWRHLAQHRHLARQAVDIVDGEVGAGFGGYCKEVEHGVGGAAHGYVEAHGVEHRGARSDGAREHALVAVAIVFPGVFNNNFCGAAEKIAAHHVCGDNGSVAGQAEADGLDERVHGVGGEHSRA